MPFEKIPFDWNAIKGMADIENETLNACSDYIESLNHQIKGNIVISSSLDIKDMDEEYSDRIIPNGPNLRAYHIGVIDIIGDNGKCKWTIKSHIVFSKNGKGYWMPKYGRDITVPIEKVSKEMIISDNLLDFKNEIKRVLTAEDAMTADTREM